MMRKTKMAFMAVLLLAAFFGCTKIEFGKDYEILSENENTSIMFTDLQTTPFITDYMKAHSDLLELFGEENIYFGDTPPTICSLEQPEFQIKADDGIYATAKSYVDGFPEPLNLPSAGSIQPIKYYHRFYDQSQSMIKYMCKTVEGTDEHVRSIDTVFLMGHDDCFTAYYYEIADTPGHPINAIVISGKKTDGGIADYRYGVKIVEYTTHDYDPTAVFGAGSIHIFKERDNLADWYQWYDEHSQSLGFLP